MIRAVLADAGPLYAAVDPDDARHQQALRELRQLDGEHRHVVVSYPTLLEAYSLVLFRLGRKTASNWLADIAGASLMNPLQRIIGWPGPDFVRCQTSPSRCSTRP